MADKCFALFDCQCPHFGLSFCLATLKAFQSHQLVDPLVSPGTADLTADVDFAYLQRMIADRCECDSDGWHGMDLVVPKSAVT